MREKQGERQGRREKQKEQERNREKDREGERNRVDLKDAPIFGTRFKPNLCTS